MRGNNRKSQATLGFELISIRYDSGYHSIATVQYHFLLNVSKALIYKVQSYYCLLSPFHQQCLLLKLHVSCHLTYDCY